MHSRNAYSPDRAVHVALTVDLKEHKLLSAKLMTDFQVGG
jgi:hypothetical protein